jgi:DNA-binding response OmpR family regulator
MTDNLKETTMEIHTIAKVILIVEDDAPFGDFLYQAIVQETLHQPILVTDGIQALNTIKEVTPDLLILDYNLPNMNGIELYDMLHSQKALEHVPTIMASAGVLEHNFQGRPIVGISKPVSLNKLLDLVVELVG